jgi:hypothetical protein
MEDADIPTSGPLDWEPMTNKCDLAVLGKLGEEVCEAGAKLFRAIIQGINEADLETGKINKNAIEDELADIEAMIRHATLQARTKAKFNYKLPWFLGLNGGDSDANRT